MRNGPFRGRFYKSRMITRMAANMAAITSDIGPR